MKTIFLVDDDDLINYVHAKVIGISHPGKVVKFTSPGEALRRLNEYVSSSIEQFPEIIFLDINMPGINGWEFLEQFEKLPNSILAKCNIVMLSSSIDREDIAKSKNYKSVKEFISKPLTQEKLAILSQKGII